MAIPFGAPIAMREILATGRGRNHGTVKPHLPGVVEHVNNRVLETMDRRLPSVPRGSAEAPVVVQYRTRCERIQPAVCAGFETSG